MSNSISLKILRENFSYSEIVDGVHLAPEKPAPSILPLNFTDPVALEAGLNPPIRESVQEMVDRGVSRVKICCNGTFGL